MRLLLPFLLALSLPVFADHRDIVCENALIDEPLFTQNLVATMNVVESHKGATIFKAKEKILALEEAENKIFVLTHTKLVELSKDGSLISLSEMDAGRSLAIAGNQVLIVSEAGYVMSFDVSTKTEVWSSRIQEVNGGKPVAVTFHGKNAHVLMTSTHEGGFNGIATLNAETGKFISKAGYDYVRAGVIDPEATGKWHQGHLILNNGGWIHVITAAQLAKGKTFRPVWKAVQVGAANQRHYMMLKGGFYLEGKELIGCGYFMQDGMDLSKLFTVPVIK